MSLSFFQKYRWPAVHALFIHFICLVLSLHAYGQKYRSNNNAVTFNYMTYPFTDTVYTKVEMCYTAGDMKIKPGAAAIKTIYFRMQGTGGSVISNLKISMTQVPATDIKADNDFISPVKTVYGPKTYKLDSPLTNGSWHAITLDSYFVYDPGKVLIVTMEHTHRKGPIAYLSYDYGNTGLKRYFLYGKPGSSTGEKYYPDKIDFGFDLVPWYKTNAGIVNLEAPKYYCANMKQQNITVRLANYGRDTLKTAKIDFTVNGIAPGSYTWTGAIPPGRDTPVVLDKRPFLATNYNFKFWAYSPNGRKDSFNNDDTLIYSATLPLDTGNEDIRMNPFANDSVEVGGTYKDNGVFVINYLYTDLKITKTGTFYQHFPTAKADSLGAYTINYNCVDWCGNVKVLTRNVKVLDHTPPDIQLKGSSIVSICQGNVYQDSGYTCSDNYNKLQDIEIDTFGSFITAGGTQTPGQYFIRYKATDKSGNAAYTANRTVFVISDSVAPCHNAGIDNQGTDMRVRIYPNPGSGHFKISGLPLGACRFMVSDITGKILLSTSTTRDDADTFAIDLSGLKSGMYIVFINSTGMCSSQKIVINR